MLVYSTMWRGIDSQACLGGEFVRMSAIGVHVTKRRRGSSIAEKMHELVNAFGVSDMEAGNWLVSKRRGPLKVVNRLSTYSQN